MGVPVSLGRGVTLEREVLFALREHRDLFIKLTLSVVGYGAANALLALSAGAVAEAWGTTPFDHPVVPGQWSFRLSIAAASYVGLGAAIVKAGLGSQVSASERRLGATVSGRLRHTLMSRFLERGTGMPAPTALALVAVRLREIEGGVIDGVVGCARSLAQLVPLAACLLALSPKLALGAAAVVMPFTAFVSVLRHRLRGATEQAQANVEALESGVDELVRNVDLFRAYGAGERALEVIDRSESLSAREAARLDGARALASGFNEVMAALAIVGVVALAGRFGLPTGGAALVPFAAVFFMGYRPLRDFGDGKAWIERGSVALDAVHNAMQTPIASRSSTIPQRHEPSARGGLGDARQPPGLQIRALPAGSASDRDAGTKPHDAQHRPPLTGSASDRDAGTKPHDAPYRPPPPEIVATDFGGSGHGGTATFRVAPGQIVCIVGPTGSGKTTLFRAMLGLERARGQLLVDGDDLTHREAGPDVRPFAWVPQEAPLITGTIVDNVALFGGRQHAADALRLVGAEQLAAQDEIVGPGGRPLSGGERRLLALARAFASELPVLLLDEPTEGLDAVASRRVLDAIARLRGKRTIVVATHREEVMEIASHVVQLEANAHRHHAAE